MKTFRIIQRTSVTFNQTFKIQERRLLGWSDVTEQFSNDPEVAPIKWFQSEGDARAWIESQATPLADQIIAVIQVQ